MKHDLLTFADWQPGPLTSLLALAGRIKAHPHDYQQVLAGKSVVALFEKPSLRTRVSFDIGINKLGGHMVYLDSQAGKLAGREDAKDMGANLSCWADAIVARVFDHNTLEQLAEAASVPVINALCDRYHPCQALADYLTLSEVFGDIKGRTLAYVGDGNNVTHSLLIVGALLGVNVTVVTPPGHEVEPDIWQHCQSLAATSGAELRSGHGLDLLEGADVLYTDTWLSMGDDTPLATIKERFVPYQVNQAMLDSSGARYVMHCQPAHRDLEITSDVIDGPASLLMQQAENRMHGQNAILATLLGGIELDRS